MKDNLELWKKVEETNPNYTKQANVKGNKITSIAPQYQIKNVTEQFGVYGSTWGLKDLRYDYTLTAEFGLVVLHCKFFFPNGEFEISNAISLFMDKARTMIDDNFAKKLETDILTKAISKLGFNADIFMGKFDDLRYLEQVKDKYKEEAPKPKLDEVQWTKAINGTITGQYTAEYIRSKYDLTDEQNRELIDVENR